ncbi:MAG TPA: Ig-like domain-containing protein, partial [Candidatus Thermoplasmatota archaeon]|nr:Ig-like domain-containing protein [Candidatus Thermoplasmatota archaeon]
MTPARALRLAGAALLLLAALAMAAEAQIYGPDSSPQKYRIKDSAGGGDPYAPNVAFGFDLEAGSTPLTLLEEQEATGANTCIPFGTGANAWKFPFYGVLYDCVRVADNGYLRFGPAPAASSVDAENLAAATAPNNVIAMWWTDLGVHHACSQIAGGNAKFRNVAGADPRLIITFRDVHAWGSLADECDTNTGVATNPNAPLVTFQAVLRPNGNILLQYEDARASAPCGQSFPCPVGIGIEDATGTNRLVYALDDETAFSSHALRIYPNHPPVAQPKLLVVNEDDPGPTTLTLAPFNARDEDGDLYKVVAVTPPAKGTLTVFDTGISYKPGPAHHCGTDTVTYTLQDALGLEASSTVEIIISCVNDKPSYTPGATHIAVEEDAGFRSIPWATDIRVAPPEAADELASQQVVFDVKNDAPMRFSIQPGIDSAGVLTFQTAPHVCSEKPVNVEVRGKDNGGTAFGGDDVADPALAMFTIQIGCRNDPPVFSHLPQLQFPAGSGPVDAAWASSIRPGPPEAVDEAAQKVVFTVGDGSGDRLTLDTPRVLANGRVVVRLDPTECGEATFPVHATDDGTPPAVSATALLRIVVPCELDARDDER